jgi:hypothetical protein
VADTMGEFERLTTMPKPRVANRSVSQLLAVCAHASL